MLIREDGRFVTQREIPELCLVEPTVHGDDIELHAPGMSELTFRPTRDGDVVFTSVWRDNVQAVAQATDASDWFSEFLKTPVKLVGMQSEFERKVDRNFATSESDVVGFADGFSLLLISEASLSALNDRLDESVPMSRFRPNIVVTGCEPHAEDMWKEFTIGSHRMSGVKPCARCSIVTTDQKSASRGVEPAKTLAEYRRYPLGVMFGMNLIHHGSGSINIGDGLAVSVMHDPDWMEALV